MFSSSQMFAASNRLLLHATLALALLVVLSVPRNSAAQRHGGPPGGGGFPGGIHTGEMGGGFSRAPNAPTAMNRGTPRMHGGLQVGPPSRWWDDKHFVKQLKLTDEQQRHMDAIFEQNRPMLLKRYESLQQEEQRMKELTHAKALDEPALFAQIDRIEQARADLGKATLHYQLQIHNELDANQIAKLEDEQ